MSATSGRGQNASAQSRTESHLKVVTSSPDGRSIFFKNKGLFAENYLVNHLPNERNDSFILQRWQTEDTPEFSACYEWMLSTWEEYKEILPTLSEAQLEERWIRPILQRLGWEYEVQDRLQKRGKTQIPDYSLFASSAQYKKAKQCKSDEQYFAHVEAIADAKAMGTSLDGTGKTNSNPSYQIVRYLEDTEKNWGILTDGEYWRLYFRGSKSRYTTDYEVNVRRLLSQNQPSPRNDEAFKFFFNFFSKSAIAAKDAAGKNFLDIVYESGERYAQGIEKDLKGRAFRIVETIAQGFLGDRKSVSDAELQLVYKHSLYYLFRLMFVLNCESKGLLDVTNISDYFPYSLRALVSRLKKEFERSAQWSRSSKAYEEIRALFAIIRDGDSTIGVNGFGEELFKSDEEGFFEKNRLPDSVLNKALVELACSYSETGEFQYVDFARLEADHIGSVFEGLLEYRLFFADCDYYVNEDGTLSAGTPNGNKSAEKIAKGTVCLVNDSGERRNTGAYYTPDAIVDYICKETLGPICENLSAEQILQLKICDPAVGSGHFLLGVVRYLEERALECLYNEDEKAVDIDPAEIRWKVLHNCVYGADINPLAIELTKFSLWIYTARARQQLEPLDDQLHCGNSLIDDPKLHGFVWRDVFGEVFQRSAKGFDAVVGNPPYVFARNKKFSSVEKDAYAAFKFASYQVNTYGLFVERALSLLGAKGKLGYIIPNNWLTISTMSQFRKSFVAWASELKIVNNKYSVFDTASVDTSLVVASKSGDGKAHLFESSDSNTFEFVKSIKLADCGLGEVINFTANQGGVDPSAIRDRISRNARPLSEVALVKAGLKAYETGKGKPKQTEEQKKKRVYHSRQKINKSYRIYLEGKDVCRYYAGWSGQYLSYGENLAAPRDPNLFSGARILVRQIPSKPPTSINGCIVTGEELNDINSMIVKPTAELDIEFILGVLNSRIVTFWFDIQFQKFQRKTFPQFKVNELADFPIPNVNLSDPNDRRNYVKIIQLVKLLRKQVPKVAKEESPSPEFLTADIEIEYILGKMFKIPAKDLDFILKYYLVNKASETTSKKSA